MKQLGRYANKRAVRRATTSATKLAPWATGLAAVLTWWGAPAAAWADGFTKDQIGTVAKSADYDNRPNWMKKMSGSSVELSAYVGSGTFYTSYSNPYVSNAIFARPTYDLGTRFKLSANARVYVEQEYTKADLPNGRGFNPYDIWLWLSARELHKFERYNLKLGGTFRVVVPLSYESRYAHMVTGLATGLNLTRNFELGHDAAAERRWTLTVVLGSVFTKYFYTSDLRGSSPGDTTGCRRYLGAGLASGSTGGPSGSESDRCGGPVNTNFALTSSGTVSLARGKWNLAVILLVANSFRYQIPIDANSPITADDVGQSDTTWGIISLGYSFTDHFGVSAGLSSFQPALDSRYRNLRFPFFDLSGGANANNYTQVFASVSGTL